MKLYTEEVLRNSMNSVKYYMEHYDASTIDSIIEKHIKALGSIELPSDEDIEKYANYAFPDAEKIGGESYTAMRGLKIGAKWVIEKIKQQEKDGIV